MSHGLEDLGALSPLKRALLALTDLQARVDADARARSEPIAIIGLGCRFPGAATPAFWRLSGMAWTASPKSRLTVGMSTLTTIPTLPPRAR